MARGPALSDGFPVDSGQSSGRGLDVQLYGTASAVKGSLVGYKQTPFSYESRRWQFNLEVPWSISFWNTDYDFFLNLCMFVLMYTICVQVPTKAGGCHILWGWVIGDYELPCESWEPNSGSVQEQVLLIAKPSLQPTILLFELLSRPCLKYLGQTWDIWAPCCIPTLSLFICPSHCPLWPAVLKQFVMVWHRMGWNCLNIQTT